MKVSIITPVLNDAGYIGACLASVAEQDYLKLEHIVIDGGSTDGTLAIISAHEGAVVCVSNKEDKGVYDALNIGLSIANGDLVGVLGADDRLAGKDVIRTIVTHFRYYSCDAVFGHLNFVARGNPTRTTRKWKTRPYVRRCLELGWMPPHPAFYVKRELLASGTPYSLSYGTSGDYEFLLRLLYKEDINAVFVDKLLVVMLDGGMSNKLSGNLVASAINDYKILVSHNIPKPLLALFLKKLRKVTQLR